MLSTLKKTLISFLLLSVAGCSTGLRIVVSLYYELERQGKTLGGASLCVGTGPSMASLWTRDI